MSACAPPKNGEMISVVSAMAWYRRSRPDILAIVRNYNDRHEGAVKVNRTYTGGRATITHFTLCLGLHEELRRKK